MSFSMDVMAGLRAAMAAVDAYYQERGIFQDRFADVVGIEEVENYLRALRISCGESGHGEA